MARGVILGLFCPKASYFNRMRNLLILLLAVLAGSVVQAQPEPLFTSGQGGYTCYRIPALVAWGEGTLLSFAEGRADNCADFGNVDILMRKSVDGGKNWSAAQVVADNGALQAGNPTPVLDTFDPQFPGGRLFLFYNTGTASEYDTRMGLGRRRAYYITSTDQGETWSEPTEISSQIHFDVHSDRPQVDARTLAFAPGHALQFSSGTYKGRIFVPTNHSTGPPQEGFKDYQTYGAFSDDHGKTWAVSEDLGVPSSNEAMAAQIAQDELLLLVRMQNSEYRRKLLARSRDGGASWDTKWLSDELTTPMCQSAIMHCEDLAKTFHLGPADTTARAHLTLWSSTDKGRSWQVEQEVFEGSSAYSDLVYLGNGRLGVFYERNDYEEIVFEVVELDTN